MVCSCVGLFDFWLILWCVHVVVMGQFVVVGLCVVGLCVVGLFVVVGLCVVGGGRL